MAFRKTLVPPIHQKTGQFEIYGRSDPSHKVGGDLVDVVLLDDGSAIAYLADIAGHGLPGRHSHGHAEDRSANRTHRRVHHEAGNSPPLIDGETESRPSIRQRGAVVCHFRRVSIECRRQRLLRACRSSSHPSLQSQRSPRYLSAEQFPIGLLPVDDFTSEAATSTPGDLFIALTDGIIEACSKEQEEFGFDRVQAVIAGHATRSLPVLADAILTSARAFGRQIDDQTLLLIRRELIAERIRLGWLPSSICQRLKLSRSFRSSHSPD